MNNVKGKMHKKKIKVLSRHFSEIKAIIWLTFDSLLFTTEHLIIFLKKRGKKVQTTPYFKKI